MNIGYADLPRPIRSGLVLVDPTLGIPRRVIVMQFNPDTLSRTLTPQTTTGESGDRPEALRLTAPAIEARDRRSEYFSLYLMVRSDSRDQARSANRTSETAAPAGTCFVPGFWRYSAAGVSRFWVRGDGWRPWGLFPSSGVRGRGSAEGGIRSGCSAFRPVFPCRVAAGAAGCFMITGPSPRYSRVTTRDHDFGRPRIPPGGTGMGQTGKPGRTTPVSAKHRATETRDKARASMRKPGIPGIRPGMGAPLTCQRPGP